MRGAAISGETEDKLRTARQKVTRKVTESESKWILLLVVSSSESE